MDCQKPAGSRNRKQSLKVAELLQDGATVRKLSLVITSIPADIDILLCLSQAPFSHSSSSSLSSGWSSDSEDPAPSPQLQPPALILDTNLEQANGGVKKTEEEEGWGSSEGASPDTSFDDY